MISNLFRNRIITVGVTSVKANIFVTSIVDPMLLGLDVLISLGATMDIPRSKLTLQKGQVDIFIGPVDPVCSLAYVNGTYVVNSGNSKFVALTCPVHMDAALFRLPPEWDILRGPCGLVCPDNRIWGVSV